MGMYDRILCHYPIEAAPVREWQTKDTPVQKLRTYTITAAGRLTLGGRIVPFAGVLVFYGCENGDTDLWWEYQAAFKDSQVIEMEVVRRPTGR